VIAGNRVGRQPHDAAAVGQTIFVGNELSNTVSLIRGGKQVSVEPAPRTPVGTAGEQLRPGCCPAYYSVEREGGSSAVWGAAWRPTRRARAARRGRSGSAGVPPGDAKADRTWSAGRGRRVGAT
jgi:hypothetical protein